MAQYDTLVADQTESDDPPFASIQPNAPLEIEPQEEEMLFQEPVVEPPPQITAEDFMNVDSPIEEVLPPIIDEVPELEMIQVIEAPEFIEPQPRPQMLVEQAMGDVMVYRMPLKDRIPSDVEIEHVEQVE